jgi:outer membrane protein/protease secretion system outer membrane protein
MTRTARTAALMLSCCLAAIPAAAATLDLLQAYRAALVNDASYLGARAATEAAREAVPQAEGALLPTIALTGSRSRNSTDTTTILRKSHTDYVAEQQALTIRQQLFRPASWAQLEQAQAQTASAEASLDKELQALATRTAGAYFDILAAAVRVKSMQAQKEAYATQLAYAERALVAGTGTRTDIDDAKSRFDMATAQEIEARLAVTVLEKALAALIGERVAAASLKGIDAARIQYRLPDPPDLEQWLELAETNNPELASLRHKFTAAQSDVAKYRAGHLPTVDLIASKSISSSESNNTIGTDYNTRSVGIQFNIPLYQGGQIASSVRQAVANLEAARQQVEAARKQLEVSVTKEFSGIVQGIARIQALEQALRSAQQLVVSTRKGILAGTRSTVDVLNAQQQVASTSLDLATARYTYLVGTLRLRAAAGLLTEDDIIRANQALGADGGI